MTDLGEKQEQDCELLRTLRDCHNTCVTLQLKWTEQSSQEYFWKQSEVICGRSCSTLLEQIAESAWARSIEADKRDLRVQKRE